VISFLSVVYKLQRTEEFGAQIGYMHWFIVVGGRLVTQIAA